MPGMGYSMRVMDRIVLLMLAPSNIATCSSTVFHTVTKGVAVVTYATTLVQRHSLTKDTGDGAATACSPVTRTTQSCKRM